MARFVLRQGGLRGLSFSLCRRLFYCRELVLSPGLEKEEEECVKNYNVFVVVPSSANPDQKASIYQGPWLNEGVRGPRRWASSWQSRARTP